jgi:hypothetical protein
MLFRVSFLSPSSGAPFAILTLKAALWSRSRNDEWPLSFTVTLNGPWVVPAAVTLSVAGW